MPNDVRIAPSILAADFTRLGEQIAQAEAAGADLIHIDVMDGSFVPNITMGPLVVEAVRHITDLPLDVHLMIVEPARHVNAFASAGANSITIHIEADRNLHQTLSFIKTLGCAAGVSINPHTPADALQGVMSVVDLILVMTVNPGFGGQSFLPETMIKVSQLRTMIDKTDRQIDLEVDGGINTATAPVVARAGANVLVAGSAIFNKKRTVTENMQNLRQVLS